MTSQPANQAPRPPYQARKFTVTCAHCGDKFEAESDRARYCPPPKGCKQAAYRHRKERQNQASEPAPIG